MVRAYHKTYGLQVTTSNCSNNFGPYQFPEKLIPLLISNILDGKPLPVYGDGKQIRDWLYVDDHNYGVDLILHHGKVGETYNIGGNNETVNIDMVNMVCDRMDTLFAENKDLAGRFPDAPCGQGKKSKDLIDYVQDRAGHDRRYAIDAGKISSELGYSPKESFETGMDKTLEWYLTRWF